jgi:hypothetical protein
MQAAHAYSFHKRHAGVNIQPYHCRHCGGIHVGHFRQDDLPQVEVIMSKTRVYAVWFDGVRESAIFLDRQEAEAALAHFAKPIVMEKDISEEEYAELCADEMEQRARQTARNPWPAFGARSNPAAFPKDSWMSDEDWRESSEPEPLKKGRGAR